MSSNTKFSKEVDTYISESSENFRPILEEIRRIFHAEIPDIIESYKWSRPIFGVQKDIAYIKEFKQYVTLGFYKASNITSNTELLEGTGKDMRHIKIRSIKEIDETILKKWIKECQINKQ